MTALDQLASLARTALTDPDALPDEEYQQTTWGGERGTPKGYAVDRLDEIIGTLNPSDWTTHNGARALTILGRHLADVVDGLEAADVLEPGRSMIGDSIRAALDHVDQAIEALNAGDE